MRGTLYLGVAAIALLPVTTFAQSLVLDCTLVDGVLPQACEQPNAGLTVAMPTGENTELETFPDGLGDEGFLISIDTVSPGQSPVFLGGNRGSFNELRRVDRILQQANVDVRYDGLQITPRLSVSTADMRRTYVAGDQITFNASSNYPAYIARSEVRIVDVNNPGTTVAVLPVASNGDVNWAMPAAGAGDLAYALRVYDSRGRYDETRLLPLSRTTVRQADPVLDGSIIRAGEGEDLTQRRTIPLTGGTVTVSSDNVAAGTTISLLGETITVGANGAFAMQRILPPGVQNVRIGAGSQVINRKIEIPQEDFFYIATIDVTATQDGDEWDTFGRVAGYARGRTASGLEITAAIDTKERELGDLFSDLGAREPLNLLRSIQADDVYLTFGDDSTVIEDAPTSGNLFLRIRKDNSEAILGDFKLVDQELSLVRSDRTLYGVAATYEGLTQTGQGEPQVRASAYAAQPDRLAQRDVFDVTGGTFYALQRQGILTGTSTVIVQYRDGVSGRIVRQQQLVEGVDYEVNHFQGVILLAQPVLPNAGDSLLSDNGLGKYEGELVVQYEFVPTLGVVDGNSVGARAETWLTDNIRVGVSGQQENTGLADNTLIGADILIRQSEQTYARLQWAQSEGPGFGTSTSVNGGFDFDTATSVGAIGQKADALSVELAADLAELTDGAIVGGLSGYYDRKEAGFVSADYNIAVTQEAYGVAVDAKLNESIGVSLAYDNFKDDNGVERQDTRAGINFAIAEAWSAELQALQTKRTGGTPAGERTDVAARLTYQRNDDYKAWVFGQTTVEQSGGLVSNDRYGIGAAGRLSDSLTGEIEISDGDRGQGGLVTLTYEPNAGSQYYLGYRLDPLRAAETAGFSGSDGGSFVVGNRTQINEATNFRFETDYDLAGNNTAQNSVLGITYTPNEQWVLDGGVIFGEREDPISGTLTRRGLTVGAHYSEAETSAAGVTGEYRIEDGDDDTLDRTTWGVSAYGRYQASPDYRLLADLDALISDGNSDIRDGRYIEARFGTAYRPVDNERVNALFSYTYLEDLPGQDQVNLEGDVNGPRQRSHILSADVNYDIDRQWTIGAKYGYRRAEVETTRGSDDFQTNTAHLGILRADYHVVSLWDISAEARVMHFEETGVTETGGLVGVWRHLGNNVKIGAGYQFNDISDDLRQIEGRKEGLFLNIIAKF